MQHAGFVRALARGLLLDSAAADDVVQETMLAALRKPPGDPSRLRAWLGAVGRRIALKRRRTDCRRPRRERKVARSEAMPSAAELAAQVEIQKRVVDAVGGLEEPYRSTIVLRYFHDLRPTEIAAGLDLPVKTVEARLTRAHAQLRARLDGIYGGDRRAWSVALLPVAIPHATTAAAAGTLILGAQLKIAALVAAIVLGGAGVWAITSIDRDAEAERVQQAAAPVAVAPTSAATDPAPADSPPAPAEKKRAAGPGRISGRILLEDADPVEGVRVRVEGRSQDGARIRRETRTDPTANFHVGELPFGSYQVFASHQGYAPIIDGHYYSIHEVAPEFRVTLMLNRGATLRVRVTDGNRRRVGVQVELVQFGDRFTDDAGEAVWSHLAARLYSVETRVAGMFFRRLIHVKKRDRLEMEIGVGRSLTGRLTGHGGAPVRGAQIQASSPTQGSADATTGDDGRYTIPGLPAGEYTLGAVGAGFAMRPHRLTVDERARTEHDFSLGACSVTGRVDPVPRLQLRAWIARGQRRLLDCPTDDDGRFAFWSLEPGEYRVGASTTETANKVTPRELALARGSIVEDFVLKVVDRRYGFVDVTTVDEEGALVDGVQFYVGLDSGGSTSIAPARTGPGRRHLVLTSGRRTIRAQKGSLSGELEVELRPGETLAKRLVLR